MRKFNSILSAIILAVFMLHGILGGLKLLGAAPIAGKLLAWIGVGAMAVHAVIGAILTIQTLRASKKNGEAYLKQNALFWTRRASGLAILVMIFFHIGAFGYMNNGNYILYEFTVVKLIAHLLLIASLFVHIFVNIRPLLISKGIIKHKERRVDIFLILSVLLLFVSGAVIFYFVSWQVV